MSIILSIVAIQYTNSSNDKLAGKIENIDSSVRQIERISDKLVLLDKNVEKVLGVISEIREDQKRPGSQENSVNKRPDIENYTNK